MYTFPSLAMYSALGFESIRARIAEKNARKVEQLIASSYVDHPKWGGSKEEFHRGDFPPFFPGFRIMKIFLGY